MKLYIVTNERGDKRYTIAGNAVDARRYAIDSCIGGHKIERPVFRTSEGQILEIDHKPGVIREEEALAIVNAAGYNLDGSKYQKPTKAKRGRAAKITPDGRRTCLRCGETKSLEEFPPRSGGGYQSYCRPCKIIYDRKRRAAKKKNK